MRKKKLLVGVAVVFALLLLLGGLYWYFFVDMSHLPLGELEKSVASPTGEYSVNLYLCNGGATTAYAIRGEVVSAEGKRNIYWQYKETNTDCRWLSERVVSINGIELDVTEDSYDWRRH